MTLDLCVAALIGLLAVLGYFSGAVRQVSHGIGIAAAFMFARPAAAVVGPRLSAAAGWPEPATVLGLNIVFLPLILIAASQAGRLVLNLLEPGEERGPLDRGIGVVVGGAKGAAIAYLLLCLAASLERPLEKIHFDLETRTRGSASMAFTREHNLFGDEELPGIGALKKIMEARSDPKAMREMLKDDALKPILSDKALGSALNDSSLQDALRRGDSSLLLKNPAIRKLLTDPEIARRLERF